MIEHLCKPGDIRGLGKRRACVRVLYCLQCKRNIVPDAPTCEECSYCRRTQERKAGKDWKPNAAV